MIKVLEAGAGPAHAEKELDAAKAAGHVGYDEIWLVALHVLALYLAQVRGTLAPDVARGHLEDLNHLNL